MIPIFALLAVSQIAHPMDTGLVVQAMRTVGPVRDTMVQVRAWNASNRKLSELTLRFHFNADSASMDKFGLVNDATLVFDADGMPLDNGPLFAQWKRPVAGRVGCAGGDCPYSMDLVLPDLVLEPLQGLSMACRPVVWQGGLYLSAPPSHLPGPSDWSFSNLGAAVADADDLVDLGPGYRATRIEAFSQGVKVWGNAPGESFERPQWPSHDAGKASFARIAWAPSDTVPVSVRDERNRKLGRWLVNQAGYRLSDVKAGRARVLGVGVDSWRLLDRSGAVVGSGTTNELGYRIAGRLLTRQHQGEFTLVANDTGELREGMATEARLPKDLPVGGPYRFVSESDTSMPFLVDDDIYGMVRDAALRFFGAQRSGNTSSWFRGATFPDDPVPGGWYDCGDRLKEGLTQGYAMAVLAELAAVHPERDPDRTSFLQTLERPDGTPDILRELRHGVEYALASWDLSGKDPANMVVSVGDFQADHASWVHDVWIESLGSRRGGPASRSGRREMGGNIAGSWAAGLAFAARLHEQTDPVFAFRAIEAAKGIYAWGKAHPAASASTSYRDNESSSEMALAAVALLWATRDTSYLYDLVSNDSLAQRNPADWRSSSGWLGRNPTKVAGHKGAWFMDMANPHPLALHSFLKLILSDPDTAARHGVAESAYDSLRERAMGGVIRNLSMISSGGRELVLPDGGLPLDGNWSFPFPTTQWGTSRYFSGNLAEMLLYVDLARDFARRPTPRFPAGTDFRADTVEALAISGMDYLLGQNPWEMSFLTGVGSKNMNHIHHRTANPEGSNQNGLWWPYRTLVGALMGGGNPHDTLLRDEWMDYTNSETCLDFSASFLIPATLLAKESEPVSGIRIRSSASVSLPRFTWSSATEELRWKGAASGTTYEIIDLRGARIAADELSSASGSRRIQLPSGVHLLRWRDDAEHGVVRLTNLSR